MKSLKATVLLVGCIAILFPLMGQDELLDQFKTFAANTTRERAYLHLNQHLAQPGDRIWFGAYVFDDGTQQLSAASKVLYVNVVDRQGSVILDEKIPLEGGRGEGYLDIPDDFQKGVYLIRAYTGWMRNFEPEHFFRDWLWISLKPQAIKSVPVAKLNLNDLTVSITPEGNLTAAAGLTARYAVEVKTREGKSVALNGNVLDDRGEIIASFSTNAYGYGAFILRPNEKRSYRISLQAADGTSAAYPFPEIKEEGVAMLLAAQPTYIRVSLQSNWKKRSGHRYRLMLQSKGTIYLDQFLDFDQLPAQVISIPTEQLKPGIYQLVLLGDEFSAMGERVFQIYPEVEAPEIRLSGEKMGRRDQLQASFDDIATAAYSISISDNDMEGTYEPLSPQEMFYMSDVLEPDPAELFHFFETPFREPANWDLFLLTKRHPAYDWNIIKDYRFTYPKWPYENFISAYGQIRNADSLLLGQSLFSFYSFVHAEVIPARTDDKGWFLLPLFDFYGPTNVIGLSEKKEISFSGMHIDLESGLPSDRLDLGILQLLDRYNIQFADFSRNKLAFKNSYKRLVPGLYPEGKVTEMTREFNPVTRNSEDYMLDLREYLSFSSLREVFIEIGRGIIVREREGKKVIIMFDPVRGMAFDEPALIFINGIPTIDYELVLTLDPDIIETIKLYRSATAQERFGAMGRNGILSITTKGRSLEIPKQENITFTFEGFQYKAEFVNAPLINEKATLPDFRHQLYWNTGANMPQSIEFTTSDILSNYIIRMIGVDQQGNWKTATKEFSTLPTSVAVEK